MLRLTQKNELMHVQFNLLDHLLNLSRTASFPPVSNAALILSRSSTKQPPKSLLSICRSHVGNCPKRLYFDEKKIENVCVKYMWLNCVSSSSFFFSDEMEKIKIPKDMDDAKALGTVLSKYKDTYYTQVLVAYFATYVLYPLRKHTHLLGKFISTSCFLLRMSSYKVMPYLVYRNKCGWDVQTIKS